MKNGRIVVDAIAAVVDKILETFSFTFSMVEIKIPGFILMLTPYPPSASSTYLSLTFYEPSDIIQVVFTHGNSELYICQMNDRQCHLICHFMPSELKPEIIISYSDDTKCIMEFQNMPQEYANLLRRSLHADAPSVTIDKAMFMPDHSTTLPEEIIAHRLGLIPIHVSNERLQSMPPYYQCENLTMKHELVLDVDIPQFCEQCQALCEIDVENDGSSGQIITVTDRDIVFRDSNFVPFSVYRNCSPIPIMRIGPGQHFHVRAVAVKAIGRVHAKWSPVSACPLVPKVRVNAERTLKLAQDAGVEAEFANYLYGVCCRKCFQVERGQLIRVDSDKCIACDACIRTPFRAHDFEVIRPVEVEVLVGQSQLTVETLGCQTPKQVLTGAINTLIKLIEDVRDLESYKQIQDIEQDVPDIEDEQNDPNLF